MEDESKQINELKELVRQNIALTQETNEVVYSMRRSARWASLLRWAWWVFIFTASGIAYYHFVQPYVDRIEQAYTHVEAGAQQAADWQTRMNDFFKSVFGGK